MTDSLSPQRPGHSTTLTLGESSITLETGRVARQADAAVVVREKRSMVLAALVSEALHHPSRDPFLTIEYRERMAAVGRIPGNYFRRELRPGEHEILMNRTIDRCLRPIIPRYYDRSIQIQITVFSADPGSDIASLAILAASAVMTLSPVPCLGHVIGARLVQSEGDWRLLRPEDPHVPVESDVFVAISEAGLLTVEGGGLALSYEDVESLLGSIESQLEPALQHLISWRNEVCDEREAWTAPAFPDELLKPIEILVAETFASLPKPEERRAREVAFSKVKRQAVETLCGVVDYGDSPSSEDAIDNEDRVDSDEPTASSEALQAIFDARGKGWEPHFVRLMFDYVVEQAVRQKLVGGNRLDERSFTEHRSIDTEAGFLPMNHGSALLTRGETQAVVSATVGRLGEGQNHETLDGQGLSHFLVHYNFPGYATGHVARFRPPGFREHGHGHLARRALLPVIPNLQQWGKSVRVVSDITESSGSSSMATVCGASLALMDAGVPISGHVAGVAMGLIREQETNLILSDISEEEDAFGDMDLKITGTEQGLTALQLDMKKHPLSPALFLQALRQGQDTLSGVLARLTETIAEPNEFTVQLPKGKGSKSQRNQRPKDGGKQDVKDHRKAEEAKVRPSKEKPVAPKPVASKKQEPPASMWRLDYQIDATMVGRVIGSRGRNIRAIESALPVKVQAQNDGCITLQSDSQDALLAARHQVKAFLLSLLKDETYLGVVVGHNAEFVEIRIGDHLGRIVLEQWNELASEPESGQEVLTRAVGSNPQGKLLLHLLPSSEEGVSKAQNYVEEPGEFQNRTQEPSNA